MTRSGVVLWRGKLSPLVCGVFLSGAVLAQDDTEDEIVPAEHLVRVVRASLRQKGRRLPSILGDVDVKRGPAAIRKVAKVLRRTKVTIQLDSQPVSEAIESLREISGLTFMVSAKARKALKEKPATISVRVVDFPLEALINHLSFQLKTYRFTIRYGVVFLVHASEYRPKKVLRVYDVTDLVRRPRHFRAPRVALRSGQEAEW